MAYGLVEDVLTVDDAEIAAALRLTAVELKQAVEPAGAVALAALCSPAFAALRDRHSLKKVALVICGGNVDLSNLANCLAE